MDLGSSLRTLVTLAAAILLCSCASTQMTSQVNPEYAGRNFSRVMVFGNFENLKYRQLVEESFCHQITTTTTSKCFKSADLFFPGKNYTIEEIAARMVDLEIVGALTFATSDTGISTSYVPPQTNSYGSASAVGNTVTTQSTTYTSGGYNISKPWAEYKVTLMAIRDGQPAWQASASAGGNGFAKWKHLIESAAKESVAQVVKDGLFQRPPR